MVFKPAEMSQRYWESVRQSAAELGSDGCTKVSQMYQDCCFEHDIAYKTGATVDKAPVTRAEADAAFRRCMQQKSRLGRLSPMSWWRWIGVRLFGGSSWKGK